MNLTLTPQEINQIIESLLFASSVSIGADWHKEDCEDMLKTALYLKEQMGDNLNLENINFYKEEDYEDSCSQQIFEEFGDKMEIFSLENI